MQDLSGLKLESRIVSDPGDVRQQNSTGKANIDRGACDQCEKHHADIGIDGHPFSEQNPDGHAECDRYGNGNGVGDVHGSPVKTDLRLELNVANGTMLMHFLEFRKFADGMNEHLSAAAPGAFLFDKSLKTGTCFLCTHVSVAVERLFSV